MLFQNVQKVAKKISTKLLPSRYGETVKCSAPPNVILIVIDALRWDGLSCYGNKRRTSPNIDKLAQRGILFTQAISSCSLTPGAIGALMTSKYPSFITDAFDKEFAFRDFGYSRFLSQGENANRFPASLPTLARILSENGYKTAGFISNPILTSEFGFCRGFDEYEEFEKKHWKPAPNAQIMTKRIINWLPQRDGDKFFLFAHYMDVHFPYCPPRPYSRMFPADYIRGERDENISNSWFGSKDQVFLKKIQSYVRALYDGQIRYVDDRVGKLFRILEKRGLLDNTLIILLSDHGDEFLEHGGTHHWPKLYDELVRIPLILHLPQVLGRKRIPNLVRTVDILPTILDILSIESNKTCDGESLIPLLIGSGPMQSRAAFMDAPFIHGVRTENYKLIQNEKSGSLELYGLHKDPREIRNIFDEDPEAAASMLEELQLFQQKIVSESSMSNDSRCEGPGDVDEEIKNRLRSLGYL